MVKESGCVRDGGNLGQPADDLGEWGRKEADAVRRPQPRQLCPHSLHRILQVRVQTDGKPTEHRMPVAEVRLLRGDVLKTHLSSEISDSDFTFGNTVKLTCPQLSMSLVMTNSSLIRSTSANCSSVI